MILKVSIPAPAQGATHIGIVHHENAKSFNSRPRAGRPAAAISASSWGEFQFPPPRRARPIHIHALCDLQSFNSRPRAGATVGFVHGSMPEKVSIPAPAQGFAVSVLLPASSVSTAPRARLELNSSGCSMVQFPPPRAGASRPPGHSFSRPPRGQLRVLCVSIPAPAQGTCYRAEKEVHTVSIPAPAQATPSYSAEIDREISFNSRPCVFLPRVQPRFNSRPRAGGDGILMSDNCAKFQFPPRARDRSHKSAPGCREFQFPPPRGGDDHGVALCIVLRPAPAQGTRRGTRAIPAPARGHFRLRVSIPAPAQGAAFPTRSTEYVSIPAPARPVVHREPELFRNPFQFPPPRQATTIAALVYWCSIPAPRGRLSSSV